MKVDDFMDNLIIDKIKDLSKTLPLMGYKICLAGSFARGEETVSSDIDIVVDTNELLLDQINFIYDYFDRDVDAIRSRLTYCMKNKKMNLPILHIKYKMSFKNEKDRG